MQISHCHTTEKPGVRSKVLLGRIIVCLGVLTVAAGCMTGNAKRFFPENKDIQFQKPVITLATPWGTETITADSVSSTVRYPILTNAPLVPTGYIPPAGYTLVPNSVFQQPRPAPSTNSPGQ